MKSALIHIVVAACICLCAYGCGRGARVIPSGIMSDIYFDMFLADQWILNHSEMRSKADSTLVYEPIFKKYGFTTADYDSSVSYYIARPDEYLKIAERTADRYQKEIARIEALQKDIRETESKNSIFQHYHEKNFDEDSVRWSFGQMKEKIDSILTEHKWIISQENTDTLQMKSSTAQ